MSRPTPDKDPEPNLASADQGDAWDEFLSEDSKELQLLKTELHQQPNVSPPAVSSVPPPVDALWKSQSDSAAEGEPPPPVAPMEHPGLALPSPDIAAQTVLDESPSGEKAFVPPAPASSVARASLGGATDDVRAASHAVDPSRGREAAEPGRVARSDSNGISLAQVLSQHVPVKWAEAVATIEELCAVLVHQAPSAPVPALQHIIITPVGDVHVLPGSKGRRDTAGVGRLLHSLLSSTATPLPLRLFVTSSIASSRYESIELYAEALADYASPNRAELIGALCRRALETPAVARQAVTVKPRAPERAGTPPQSEGFRKRRRWWVWIVVGIGVGLAGVASARIGHLSRSSIAAPGGSPVPPLESDVMIAAESAPVRPDPWALGTIMAFQADPVVAPQPWAAMSGRATVESAQGQQTTASLALPPTPPALNVATRSAGIAAEALTLPLLAVERPVSEPPAPSLESRRDAPGSPSAGPPARVYTSTDADVEPPVLMSRQPGPLPPALPESSARGTIDLLIDEEGVVQAATMVGRPQRWDEMMRLSSLKNLRYRPARKDGLPVAYRLRIHP